MKLRILTVLFLSIFCLFGGINIKAQPRVPKVYSNSVHTPPPPPIRPGKNIVPKIFNPIGHVYGLSVHGRKILYNFSPNGRVYREGDKLGNPYTLHGNVITVYTNHGPKRIVGTGKISRNGRYIEWMEPMNGTKYRLRLIG